MSVAQKLARMSGPEFLAWERDQKERHQLLHGDVYAMAGGSPRHNALASNVVVALAAALRGRACRVFSSDQKVRAGSGEDYVYPDASVVCGPVRLAPGTRDVVENPGGVVEVLSPNTEVHDRGEKWEGYQQLAGLTDFVLVSQHAVRVEHYQREQGGSWRYTVHGAGAKLRLANGAELAVDAIYDGVFELPASDPDG